MHRSPANPSTIRPLRRPSIVVRALLGLLGFAVVLFNIALMLSDRAPGFLRRVFGGGIDRLSDRIDATARLPAEQLPGSDAVVHVAVWGAAMALAGMTVWTWRRLVLAALTVLAISLVVEIAQGVYSTSRAVEPSDAAANAVGVAVGTAVAAIAYLSWSVGSAIIGGSPGPPSVRRATRP